MSNQLNGGLPQLKKNLAGMTFKEKLDHLWTYYKGSLLVVALVIMVISIVSTAIINKSTKTLMAGIGINVSISDEGRSYVVDEYQERIGTGGLENVVFSQIYMEDFNDPASYEESYYSLMSMIALSASGDLDYLMMDQTGLENLLMHDIFKDLREFFTEAEMEAMKEKLIWLDMAEEGEPENLVPVALNITDMPFVKELGTSSDVYFGVVTNTPRMETLRDFWEYINAWE